MAKFSEISSFDNVDNFSMDELLDESFKSLNNSFSDVSLEKKKISNVNDELRSKNKSFEIENNVLKNELNIIKCKIDILENDITSLKIKSESFLDDVNKLSIKRKTLEVSKYRIGNMHKKDIPYENGFVRATSRHVNRTGPGRTPGPVGLGPGYYSNRTTTVIGPGPVNHRAGPARPMVGPGRAGPWTGPIHSVHFFKKKFNFFLLNIDI